MVNHPWEYHLDTSPHSSYLILQTQTSYRKIISIGIVFPLILILIIYFLRPPLHGLAFCSFNYPLCLFFHISTMLLHISTKLLLLFILSILCLCTLKNLQARITTLAYFRTHFTKQSKTQKSGLLFSVESKWMY